jgi:hypothetical protein
VKDPFDGPVPADLSKGVTQGQENVFGYNNQAHRLKRYDNFRLAALADFPLAQLAFRILL